MIGISLGLGYERRLIIMKNLYRLNLEDEFFAFTFSYSLIGSLFGILVKAEEDGEEGLRPLYNIQQIILINNRTVKPNIRWRGLDVF